MATDPNYSAGARYERKALRVYLERTLKRPQSWGNSDTLSRMLAWVKGRQKRYDRRAGGL